MESNGANKILFAGGGTLGSVTPLLAVAEHWKRTDASVEMVWVGTPSGPERALIESEHIRFLTLPVARLPRHPSIEWLTLPVNLVRAAIQAWKIIKTERPALVAAAGGYTGVPLVVAAQLQGIPTWIHDQDVRPILSSKLSAPFATLITVAWEKSVSSFPVGKTEWVGNPVRQSVMAGGREDAVRRFGFDPSRKTILVFGGGGGSLWLNNLMETIGAELVRDVNVIHIVGPGKMTDALASMGKHYLAAELLTGEMSDAIAAADVVVCRAGMGTISELAARRKAAIVIPLPNSPQEDNARVLEEAHAALVFTQDATTPQELLEAICTLARDEKRSAQLRTAISTLLPTNVADTLVRKLQSLVR